MNTFRLGILAAIVMASVCVANARPKYQECTSAITSNFNGTAIAEGNQIWFTSVLTVKGLGASKVNLFVSDASIAFTANNQNYNIKVPSSSIRLSPTTTLATTSFGPLFPPILGTGWKTDLPLTGLAGKDFMTAVRFAVPAGGLPGGIKDVTFTATFSSFTTGLTVNWQWAAAVYTSLDSDYNAVGVKPVDDNKASQYKNSDHAGTPENFKSFVIGGARGGGGSNFTGSYSGTGSCVLVPDGSLSITVSNSR
jgi:hypothetical protein